MSAQAFHASPLGAFIRSPLGARGAEEEPTQTFPELVRVRDGSYSVDSGGTTSYGRLTYLLVELGAFHLALRRYFFASTTGTSQQARVTWQSFTWNGTDEGVSDEDIWTAGIPGLEFTTEPAVYPLGFTWPRVEPGYTGLAARFGIFYGTRTGAPYDGDALPITPTGGLHSDAISGITLVGGIGITATDPDHYYYSATDGSAQAVYLGGIVTVAAPSFSTATGSVPLLGGGTQSVTGLYDIPYGSIPGASNHPTLMLFSEQPSNGDPFVEQFNGFGVDQSELRGAFISDGAGGYFGVDTAGDFGSARGHWFTPVDFGANYRVEALVGVIPSA